MRLVDSFVDSKQMTDNRVIMRETRRQRQTRRGRVGRVTCRLSAQLHPRWPSWQRFPVSPDPCQLLRPSLWYWYPDHHCLKHTHRQRQEVNISQTLNCISINTTALITDIWQYFPFVVYFILRFVFPHSLKVTSTDLSYEVKIKSMTHIYLFNAYMSILQVLRCAGSSRHGWLLVPIHYLPNY